MTQWASSLQCFLSRCFIHCIMTYIVYALCTYIMIHVCSSESPYHVFCLFFLYYDTSMPGLAPLHCVLSSYFILWHKDAPRSIVIVLCRHFNVFCLMFYTQYFDKSMSLWVSLCNTMCPVYICYWIFWHKLSQMRVITVCFADLFHVMTQACPNALLCHVFYLVV